MITAITVIRILNQTFVITCGCISYLFQLSYVDGICIIFAVCNIMNLLSANTDSVLAKFQSSCTVSYRKAIGIDSGISKSCTS